MRFLVLSEGRRCRVLAPLDNQDNCGLLQDLSDLSAHGKPVLKAVLGLHAVLDHIAEHGRQACAHLYHEASKKDGIYSFRKGDLRIYFFFEADAGELVVCSHTAVKNQQRAATADINAATRVKRKFEAAKKGQTLEYIGRDL